MVFSDRTNMNALTLARCFGQDTPSVAASSPVIHFSG